MDATLIFSAGRLGLVGAPHCTAMCSAPCTAVTRKCGAGTPRSALHGAAVMVAFALTSSLGLGVLPMLWSSGLSGARGSEWAARLAGLALVMGSGWTLGHGIWERVADLCLTA